MASHKTKFTVGLFMASGIGIVLLAVILLGVTRYFEKGRLYVSYFNESVQGLDVDSPVKYRGVPVGRVTAIDVAPDSKLVEVLMKIEPGQELPPDIVAQLKAVGITGAMFIELDRMKDGDADRTPRITFPTEHPIVASKPSDIRALLTGIDETFQQLKALDLAGISNRIKSTLDTVNQTLAEANVKKLSSEAVTLLTSVNKVLKAERLEQTMAAVQAASVSLEQAMANAKTATDGFANVAGGVEEVWTAKKEEIGAALSDLRAASAEARRLMASGAQLAENTDSRLEDLQRYLTVTGENLEETTASLNALIENLSSQPSQLFFGKPPAPRQVRE